MGPKPKPPIKARVQNKKPKKGKASKPTDKEIMEGGKKKLASQKESKREEEPVEKTPEPVNKELEFRTEIIHSPEDKKFNFALKFNKYFHKMNESIDSYRGQMKEMEEEAAGVQLMDNLISEPEGEFSYTKFDTTANHAKYTYITKMLKEQEEIEDFYPKLKESVSEIKDEERAVKRLPTFNPVCNALEGSQVIKMGKLVKEFFGKENLGKKIKTEEEKKIEAKIAELEEKMANLRRKQLEMEEKEEKIKQLKEAITGENNKLKAHVEKETEKINRMRELDPGRIENLDEATNKDIEGVAERDEVEKKLRERIKDNNSVMNKRIAVYKKIIEKLRERVEKETNDEETIFNRYVKEEEERGILKLQARAQKKQKVVGKEDLPGGESKKIFEGNVYEITTKSKDKKMVFPDGYTVINYYNGNIEEVLK